jgi:hypothetical protein
VVRYSWNPTNPDSIIADWKMRVGLEDEMVKEFHVHQAKDWRCLQLDRDDGTANVF